MEQNTTPAAAGLAPSAARVLTLAQAAAAAVVAAVAAAAWPLLFAFACVSALKTVGCVLAELLPIEAELEVCFC